MAAWFGSRFGTLKGNRTCLHGSKQVNAAAASQLSYIIQALNYEKSSNNLSKILAVPWGKPADLWNLHTANHYTHFYAMFYLYILLCFSFC